AGCDNLVCAPPTSPPIVVRPHGVGLQGRVLFRCARGGDSAESSEVPAVKEQTVGRVQVVAELGQGGMADVILVCAKGPAGLHKLSVIKRLRYHLADDPEF